MPSKDWINVAILMLSAWPWPARSALAEGGLAAQELEGSGAPCDGFAAAPYTLPLEHLCVVSFEAATEAPVYRAKVDERSYRFVFNAGGMALVVDGALWSELAAGSAPLRDTILSDVTPERLALWHQDALYWARWLEMVDEQWGGAAFER